MEIIASKIISKHRRLPNYSIIELFIYTTFHALKYTQYTVINVYMYTCKLYSLISACAVEICTVIMSDNCFKMEKAQYAVLQN